MSDPVAVEAAAIARDEARNARASANLCRLVLIMCVFWTVLIVLFVPFGPVIATLGPGHGVHLVDLVLLPFVAWFGWCRARWLVRAERMDSIAGAEEAK